MAQIGKNQIGFNDFSDFTKDSSYLMPKKVNISLTSLNDANPHYVIGGLAWQ